MKFEHVIAGQESEDVTRIEWRLVMDGDEPALEARKLGGNWVTVAWASDDMFYHSNPALAVIGLKNFR